MPRDLTRPQFLAALRRHGMKAESHSIMPVDGIGYVNVTPTPSGGGLRVYAPNAGDRRRDMLAYLLREKAKAVACREAREECDDCRHTGVVRDERNRARSCECQWRAVRKAERRFA